MARRRRTPEPRQIPAFTGKVIVPFSFFDPTNLDQLDPLDNDRHLMKIATGEYPSREGRPYDPLTAWVTMAYIGAIEEGGPLLKAELNREQRLEAAREVLSNEEVIVVESIAVPNHYRKLPARELEEIIRTAPDYIDRMWAGCWLELIGWTESPECSFGDPTEDFPCGELEERIVEAYAHSIGVTSPDNFLGWARIDKGYEANLVSHRLSICSIHYQLNGPPPYEYMCDTVPLGPGWRQVVRIVPDQI